MADHVVYGHQVGVSSNVRLYLVFLLMFQISEVGVRNIRKVGDAEGSI